MSAPLTTELKVGAFVLFGAALVIGGYLATMDGLRADEAAFRVHMRVPSAAGLWEGTPVQIAGVDVGAIEGITVEGNQAHVTLAIRAGHPLPIDSTGSIRSQGFLGDSTIGLDLGVSDVRIPDGGRLQLGSQPGNIDEITRQVEDISGDIKAITAVLREVVEDDTNTQHLQATLANVDAISLQLRMLAEGNRRDVDDIVDSVRRLTANLEGFAEDATADVDEELQKVLAATDRLDTALQDVNSITSKIDAGEGTIGALVNDRQTIDSLNDTIENANAVIESFSGLHAEVYYLGRAYGGTQPSDQAFFYGNPLAPSEDGGLGFSGSNTLGIELHPQEDFWWVFEINDYPQGAIQARELFYPDLGVAYTEYIRDVNYRFTFQMAKRWWDVAFRLGVKESGGGVGMTVYTLNDALQLNADVFDFAFGSYPALEASGLPNVRLGARAEPWKHVWVEGGAEQVLLGARYGYFTGYIGGGFHFSDDDIKLLFATLPLGL